MSKKVVHLGEKAYDAAFNASNSSKKRRHAEVVWTYSLNWEMQQRQAEEQITVSSEQDEVLKQGKVNKG